MTESFKTSVDEVAWTGSPNYPAELRKVYRYKALIGGKRPGVVAEDDVLMGVLELAPGAIYPTHHHPAPEIYFVISGQAEWTVDQEIFRAGPGTAILHRPGKPHRMVNVGDDVLRLVYFWWAPGGDRHVLRTGSQLLEPVPPQPARAVFESD